MKKTSFSSKIAKINLNKYRSLNGSIQLNAIILCLILLTTIPLWISADEKIALIIHSCICWVPFALALWNIYANYFIPPMNADRSDDETISLRASFLSFFFYLMSWVPVLLSIWAWNKIDSFENLDPTSSVNDMLLKFIGSAILLGNGAEFTSLIPRSLVAQFFTSFLAFNAFMITVVGFGFIIILLWTRISSRNKQQKEQPQEQINLTISIVIAVNAILTAVLLAVLWTGYHQGGEWLFPCKMVFSVLCWLPFAINVWNLLQNYVFVIFNNSKADDSSLSIWNAMISYHLMSISFALVLLLFWIYSPVNSWENLNASASVLEAWFRFVCTATLLSIGGEFMYEVPLNWASHIIVGAFSYTCAMFTISILLTMVSLKWDVIQTSFRRF